MNDVAEEQSLEPKKGTMKRKFIFIVVIAIVVLAGVFLFYFFYLENPNRQVLARVNDEKVTVEQFNKELAKVETPLMQEMLREEPNKFLEGMIMNTLLLQEAKKQGISTPVKTYKDAEKGPKPPHDSTLAPC